MNLEQLLEPVLSGMGYELVSLERAGRGMLRVFIDKDGGVTIDDCVAVSNQLTRLFMVENVDYERLEVSSPGTDRPLVKPADYVRFSGSPVKTALRVPLADGRRRLKGILLGMTDGVVNLDVEGGALRVPLTDIESTRLAPQFMDTGKSSGGRKK